MEKSLQERVFEWICRDEGFQLREIEKQCKEHLKDATQEKLVYRFILPVNIIELIQFDARLGNLALHSTLQLVALYQDVCYTSINVLKWIPAVTSSAQILVVLRLKTVPCLPEYHSIDGRSLMSNTRIHTGTFSIEGVVCSITGITQYTQSARYYCRISTCPGSSRCCYIRVHLAGRSEALTTGSTFICKYCRNTLEEDATCRTLSEKRVAYVISRQCLTTNNVSSRDQAIPIYLRDELTKDVCLGGFYRFTLFHFLDNTAGSDIDGLTSTTPVFEANNIDKANCPLFLERSVSILPDTIRLLLEDRNDSPWSFAASIAYCFGASVVHPSSFLNLKLSLVLSLVLAGTSDSPMVDKLDILVIAQDTLITQRLLMYAGSFATRMVVYSTASDLFATTSRDLSGTGTYLTNAGSMLLGNDGICLIPNMGCIKKESKERLRRALETKVESIQVPKKYTEFVQHLNVPITSSVWACYETEERVAKNAMESWDQLGPIGSIQNLEASMKALINRFGLVVNINENNNSKDETFRNSEMTLMRAMDDFDETSLGFVPDQEISEFLQFVSQRTVRLGESPQKLIQRFYLAGRRARNMEGDFPLSSLQTITSLSVAHAKLSLREKVFDEDVVAAVLLFDSSLQTSHGYSLLALQQDVLDAQSILSMKHDLKMREIQKMLYNFCSDHKFSSSYMTDSFYDD